MKVFGRGFDSRRLHYAIGTKTLSKSYKRNLIAALFILILAISASSQSLSSLKVSVRDYDRYGRVIIESAVPLSYHIEQHTSLFLVRFRIEGNFTIRRDSFKSKYVKSLGWAKGSDYYILTINATGSDYSFESFTLINPHRIVIDILSSEKPKEDLPPPEKPKRTPQPRTEQEESQEAIKDRRDREQDEEESPPVPSTPPLASQGLRTIVIDPGHGGMESGSEGKFGTLEKNLTLPISQKLKTIIEKNLAYRVVLTRDKDTNVSLENRAAIANNNRAVLFISVHVNGFPRSSARGSETYFLSLNATDEEARRLAYMENNSSDIESKISSEDEDDIMMILWDMAQSAFIKQSSELAEKIQQELNSLLGTRNRGIKQAPFKVLTGVACPAILVEIAFISNPDEERKLQTEEFQNNVARAIYRGIDNFLKNYSAE
ncbi:MAG: N-acetylmuramoyl-L-alanine amidase [Candidatus Aminicenantaceae bacterium]